VTARPRRRNGQRARFGSLGSLVCCSVVAASAVVLAPSRADAFCGFYVAPSDAPLYADASMVALMRDGTRTVLSMSNNYKGPAADFAMVVPVPVVVQKDNVKTLDKNVFQKLEKLSAPRLVEYWEQDPCGPHWGDMGAMAVGGAGGMAKLSSKGAKEDSEYKVKIEAQFTVGEYDIVVLSAQESDGLERWLRDNKYNIPKGASAALAPYIKEQQKFFVAKVDIKKVTMDDKGVAVLSPLRVAYESADFRLPVRLGLLNANGKQDLIVYVLAKEKRYEVANYKNVFIPTNIDVTDSTRNAFAPFYATLFDATIAKAGGKAVVTEYAWESSSCDPCPTPPLQDDDIATLGGDVLYGMGGADSFRFSTALGNGNVDWIKDFTVGDDSILLDNLIFTSVGGDGDLALGAFYKSSAGVAHDADDRIIYDTDSGVLSYDADGSGEDAAIQYARLSTHLTLSASDFLII